MPPPPGYTHARVRDAGDSYSVEVGPVRRELQDPERDCMERARVAAVLIALNLRRAKQGMERAAPQQRSRVPAPRAEMSVGLQVLAGVAHAPSEPAAVPGAGLGVWLQWHSLHIGVEAGVCLPARIELEPGGSGSAVKLMRIPAFVHAAYLLRVGSSRLGAFVGLGADVLHLRGVDVMQPRTSARLNPGAMLGGALHLGLTSSLALIVRISARAYPRAYDLAVEPLGTRGRTPWLWLGADLGLSVRLR